jgi:hypothetical protein
MRTVILMRSEQPSATANAEKVGVPGYDVKRVEPSEAYAKHLQSRTIEIIVPASVISPDPTKLKHLREGGETAGRGHTTRRWSEGSIEQNITAGGVGDGAIKTKAICIAHGCRAHRGSDIEMNNVGLGLVDFSHGEGRCPVVSLVFKT